MFWVVSRSHLQAKKLQNNEINIFMFNVRSSIVFELTASDDILMIVSIFLC